MKACSKALVVTKPKGTLGPEKKKVNVLDEEKYTEVKMTDNSSSHRQLALSILETEKWGGNSPFS